MWGGVQWCLYRGVLYGKWKQWHKHSHTLIARFMGPKWGPSGADRWAPCWPHGLCYLGNLLPKKIHLIHYMLNLLRTHKIQLHFLSFPNTVMVEVDEILPQGRQNLFILLIQYHCCWWLEFTRSVVNRIKEKRLFCFCHAVIYVLQTVGCDNIVDSGAKLDLCGVCQGDNSTCRLIQGQVTETMEPNGRLEWCMSGG